MDIYKLINSKAISEHCRKIQHKFNTEELVVLIYRNNDMSIEEKIEAYQEVIRDYPDMEVIERMNCKHYDSIKDMIQEEIQRLKNLKKEIQQADETMIYTYDTLYKFSKEFEESDDFYRNYEDVCNAIAKNIEDDEEKEIAAYKIIKRSLIRSERRIIEEYIVDNSQKSKPIKIYDTMEFTDIDGICLNIPTPFKKRRSVSSLY